MLSIKVLEHFRIYKLTITKLARIFACFDIGEFQLHSFPTQNVFAGPRCFSISWEIVNRLKAKGQRDCSRLFVGEFACHVIRIVDNGCPQQLKWGSGGPGSSSISVEVSPKGFKRSTNAPLATPGILH